MGFPDISRFRRTGGSQFSYCVQHWELERRIAEQAAKHPVVLRRVAVAGRHFAHRWRHSYATSLVRRGEDIHVVQRLMGHSNIAMTTRYLHLSDADLLAAIDRAFPES